MKIRLTSPNVVVTAVTAFALCAAGPAAAAPARFLGWTADALLWFQQPETGAPQVCREDTTDVPDRWPAGVTIGPGAPCADLPEKVGEQKASDFIKASLKGSGTDKKSPFGLEVKLENKDGKSQLVALDGPDKRVVLAQPDGRGVPLKVGDVQWRKDGKSVAVALVPEQGAGPSLVVVGTVEALLVGGPAGRKRAEKLVAQAQALMKKRDWSGAGRVFEEAIAASPDFAPARFGRAAAEAQGGVGRSAMIENLTWLRDNADKDKSARKLLDDAKKDAAFDAWAGEPEVRELLGLPKVSTLDVPTRLLERKATWSIQGSSCKNPWLTLVFKGNGKGGAVTLMVAESCKGKKSQKTSAGSWRPSAAGSFEIELPKLPEGVTLPPRATLVLDESYQQLKLVPEGGEPSGTFEPGAARVDDSTL